MKRQTLVEYKDASPEVQAIYDEVMEVSGSPDVFNFLKAFGNNEKVLHGYWSLLKYTLFATLLKPILIYQMRYNRVDIIRVIPSKSFQFLKDDLSERHRPHE